MGIHSQKMPASNSQITQDVLEQTETIFKDVPVKAMQIFIKYKAYYGKKNQRLKKNNQILFVPYSRNQISKEAKFRLPIFRVLDLISLKWCYRTTIIWYAKLAPKNASDP